MEDSAEIITIIPVGIERKLRNYFAKNFDRAAKSCEIYFIPQDYSYPVFRDYITVSLRSYLQVLTYEVELFTVIFKNKRKRCSLEHTSVLCGWDEERKRIIFGTLIETVFYYSEARK